MVELCDVGVTRCDVRRLEIAQLYLDLRLLLLFCPARLSSFDSLIIVHVGHRLQRRHLF